MRISHVLRIVLIVIAALAPVSRCQAVSFALDSIATWGRFPKFCIDVYRWGDGFFNGYDTTYVKGTGYKFNTKVQAESWLETYQFYLPENVRMHMTSDPSTTIGFRLTYLAVSAGYEKNISHFFGSPYHKAREQFTFGFNCSLFAFNMRFENNNGGVNIKSFGPRGNTIHPNLPFDGLHSKYFGFDTYYFFNHRQYSQAAAFGFSRVQTRSEGSWFAGVSFAHQRFNFDFNSLPPYILAALPEHWKDHRYEADTKNLAIKGGYGYNYVFRPKWLIAFSESPTVGFKRGVVNSPDKKKTSMTFSNQLRASIVWNHEQWFAGAIGEIDMMLLYDHGSAIQNSVITGSVAVGYRFNIW